MYYYFTLKVFIKQFYKHIYNVLLINHSYRLVGPNDRCQCRCAVRNHDDILTHSCATKRDLEWDAYACLLRIDWTNVSTIYRNFTKHTQQIYGSLLKRKPSSQHATTTFKRPSGAGRMVPKCAYEWDMPDTGM